MERVQVTYNLPPAGPKVERPRVRRGEIITLAAQRIKFSTALTKFITSGLAKGATEEDKLQELQKQKEALVDASLGYVFEVLEELLVQDHEIIFPTFGTFYTKNYRPKTKQARIRVVFKASSVLKTEVNTR